MELFILASFLGVIVGAVLQYWLAQRAETLRNARARRTEAYVDLIKAIAGLTSVAGQPPGESSRLYSALFAEARARAAIYGSPAVVSRLAALIRSGVDFRSDAAGVALADVVQAMRADGLGTKELVADRDVRQLLFGCE